MAMIMPIRLIMNVSWINVHLSNHTLHLNLQNIGVTAETRSELHVQKCTLHLPKAGAVVRDVGACEDALWLETCADIAGIPSSQDCRQTKSVSMTTQALQISVHVHFWSICSCHPLTIMLLRLLTAILLRELHTLQS